MNRNIDAQLYSTRVLIPSPAWKIDHSSRIHLVGSCFTDTISAALSNQKFDCFTNGQGIAFNPISIAECLRNVVERELFSQLVLLSHTELINTRYLILGTEFSEDDVFKDSTVDDTYHSWGHHSSYSSLSVPSMLKRMNDDIIAAHNNLVSAKVLFITLGTSRVHVLKGANRVVSNCHKQPSILFEKKQLSVPQIVQSLREAIIACKVLNPRLQVGGNCTRYQSYPVL